MGRLLGMTGNDDIRARYNFRNTYLTGRVVGQVWTSLVKVPQMDAKFGLERRLAVLPTDRKIDFPPHRQNEPEKCQTCLDAVITLGIIACRDVGTEGWAIPAGDESAKQDLLRDADALAAWVDELDDDADGADVANLAEQATDALGLKRLTTQKLIGVLKESRDAYGRPRWHLRRTKVTRDVDGVRKRVNVQILERTRQLIEGLPPNELPPEPANEPATLCRQCGMSPIEWNTECPNDKHGNHRMETEG